MKIIRTANYNKIARETVQEINDRRKTQGFPPMGGVDSSVWPEFNKEKDSPYDLGCVNCGMGGSPASDGMCRNCQEPYHMNKCEHCWQYSKPDKGFEVGRINRTQQRGKDICPNCGQPKGNFKGKF